MAYNNYRPSQKVPPIVLNLIIINAIVFVAQLVFDSTLGLTNILALYPYNSGLFKPYQLVTHMFAHGGFLHILFNMYALWIFGSVLERIWGPKKFLIFYLVCGLAAGLTQMFFVTTGAAIGASGAIMGLLAAFAYTFPNTEFFILPFPFPIKAKYMAAIFAAFDIFGGFAGSDNVAHFAHLGGLVMGLILVIVWNKTNKKTFY
ncbi:rhomboid family intramembrane serine protease [Ginsengibacter hankyongi]|uniref:Rhomboid family intramembrane serine protease n=1 Tax=Ginsengibacter hankyongi TaxID=2607284 RepID=A0A5J5ILZ4_9BACT|nr:rhomboid family intramembrane serine protease [Ginsengibacter hankyongi]KAA9041999.1 rhomboid family intramembrane serine protease [Ginsengibacter hankyongi]